MKKIKLFIPLLVIALLMGVGVATAKDQPQGAPFQVLWDAMAYLQEQIDNIELVPGPQGSEGPQGLQGEQGPAGEPSWDEARISALEARVTELENLLNQEPEPSTPPTYESIVIDNFNTYTDGSLTGQGGWTSNGQNFVVQGTIVFEGLKALYNNTVADSVITKSGNLLSDGKQAFYIRTKDRSSWGSYPNGNVQVRVLKGQWSGSELRNFVAVSFKSDGNIAYYDWTSGIFQNFATYNDNEWILLKIEWRSSDKTARYRINSGTWTDWHAIAGSGTFTDFDSVGFDFNLPSGSGGVYFDNIH